MVVQGILLAGGNGTRLRPLTTSINKHFLAIYDKPLIYYSLTTMLLAKVNHLVVICRPDDLYAYKELLGDGDSWGIKIDYAVQERPEGIPHALTLASEILDTSNSVFLGLGDNIIYGSGAGRYLADDIPYNHASIYCFPVPNPSEFGVAEIDKDLRIVKLVEKPLNTASNLAITGFYHLPNDSFEMASKLKKSKRGEFEIVDLLNHYNDQNRLQFRTFPRGTTWLDAGSAEGLVASAEFVRIVQQRQGILVCSPDEAAWRIGNITDETLLATAGKYANSSYGQALFHLLNR